MSETGSGRVIAVGIGSCGIRIVSKLSLERLLIDRFAYMACDESDLQQAGEGEKLLIESPVDQKLSPPIARGLAMRYHDAIRQLVSGAKVVFVIAGLGGAVGSGLAPVVAQLAAECGAVAIGVAVMPFDFEKLKFYSGLALKRMRVASKGVIIIDNESLLKTSGESNLMEVYRSANEQVASALGSLLVVPSDSSVPVGLNKVLGTVVQNGYCLLSTSSSGSVDKTEEAIAHAVLGMKMVAETKEASHVVVALSGDMTLSASDTGMAVNRLGSLMANESIEVAYGLDYRNGHGSQLLVSVLASGFKSTKYEGYDPLSAIFGNNVIDDDMDCALTGGLESIQKID